MPERIFKYQTVPELQAMAAALAQAVASGSINALKNSATGFLVQTANLGPAQVRRNLLDIRWEIFYRGRGDRYNDPDPACAQLEPEDPRLEKVMSIAPNRGGGWGGAPFGWPGYLFGTPC